MALNWPIAGLYDLFIFICFVLLFTLTFELMYTVLQLSMSLVSCFQCS